MRFRIVVRRRRRRTKSEFENARHQEHTAPSATARCRHSSRTQGQTRTSRRIGGAARNAHQATTVRAKILPYCYSQQHPTAKTNRQSTASVSTRRYFSILDCKCDQRLIVRAALKNVDTLSFNIPDSSATTVSHHSQRKETRKHSDEPRTAIRPCTRTRSDTERLVVGNLLPAACCLLRQPPLAPRRIVRCLWGRNRKKGRPGLADNTIHSSHPSWQSQCRLPSLPPCYPARRGGLPVSARQ
jgi:hypothetical protein